MQLTVLIDKIRMLLIENNVSVETITSITRLQIADKFKSLDDLNNQYAKALFDIKLVLENNNTEDFECVEEILAIFAALAIGVNHRHDFM